MKPQWSVVYRTNILKPLRIIIGKSLRIVKRTRHITFLFYFIHYSHFKTFVRRRWMPKFSKYFKYLFIYLLKGHIHENETLCSMECVVNWTHIVRNNTSLQKEFLFHSDVEQRNLNTQITTEFEMCMMSKIWTVIKNRRPEMLIRIESECVHVTRDRGKLEGC